MQEKKRIGKNEIEDAIKGKGDFIKIDYLKRFLEDADNLEIKKFIMINLVGVLESKNMLKEAVEHLKSAAEISITFREKIELYMRQCEIYIKMRDFEMSDKAFKAAYSLANSQEKWHLKQNYSELFKMQAKIAEQENRNRHCMEIYEKLFRISESVEEKRVVKEKLLGLYEKFGRIQESEMLRNTEIREEEESLF